MLPRTRWLVLALVMPIGLLAQEVVQVPFTAAQGGATLQSYSGFITISVHGSGQAAGAVQNDAFYIFTDGAGSPVTPVASTAGTLKINGQPPASWLSEIPPYNAQHYYSFRYFAGNVPAPLQFATGDLFTGDNSGAFVLRVDRASESLLPALQIGSTATL